jgi:mannose-6-phosphate isomerase-like protein (cupin superfamily)
MVNQIHVPETSGDTEKTIDSQSSAMDREIQKHRPADWAAKPQFFKMRSKLPKKGRAEALLCATDRMWIALKTYAEGGENTIHNHTNEDHSFIVLQGQGRFFGPGDESVVLGRNEGIMLPRGSFYRFCTEGDEPLVVMRIGCVVDAADTPWQRFDLEGNRIFGSDEKNNTVVTEFYEDRVFE